MQIISKESIQIFVFSSFHFFVFQIILKQNKMFCIHQNFPINTLLFPRHKKAHKSKFTKEEDQKLCELVEKYGQTEWAKVAREMPNRNPRQCRERWRNYMDPRLNTLEWSQDEDNLLLLKYQEIGPHWNKINQAFPNRSINSVRNRLVRLLKNVNMPNQNDSINLCSSPCAHTQHIVYQNTQASTNQLIYNQTIIPEVKAENAYLSNELIDIFSNPLDDLDLLSLNLS